MDGIKLGASTDLLGLMAVSSVHVWHMAGFCLCLFFTCAIKNAVVLTTFIDPKRRNNDQVAKYHCTHAYRSQQQ